MGRRKLDVGSKRAARRLVPHPRPGTMRCSQRDHVVDSDESSVGVFGAVVGICPEPCLHLATICIERRLGERLGDQDLVTI